jgi:hypothetical protein
MRGVKKGSLTTTQLISFIIGAAVFVVLTILFRDLILGLMGVSGVERSSSAYFESFMEEVDKANEGNVGIFTMWQEVEDKGKQDVFLIYFEDGYKFIMGDRIFIMMGDTNSICVCFWDGKEDVCDRENCVALDRKINYDGDYGQWAISTGDQINITRGEEEYEIHKIVKSLDSAGGSFGGGGASGNF